MKAMRQLFGILMFVGLSFGVAHAGTLEGPGAKIAIDGWSKLKGDSDGKLTWALLEKGEHRVFVRIVDPGTREETFSAWGERILAQDMKYQSCAGRKKVEEREVKVGNTPIKLMVEETTCRGHAMQIMYGTALSPKGSWLSFYSYSDSGGSVDQDATATFISGVSWD